SNFTVGLRCRAALAIMENGGATAPPYQSIFMCGIIGYIGKKSASPILLQGLRRLEYRGYDSVGVALIDSAELLIRKKKGKINEGLARTLQQQPAEGSLGIGHTRWATHGPPADENSH